MLARILPVICALTILCGCDKTKPQEPSPPEPPPSGETSGSLDVLKYEGAPVAVARPKVLHESDDFRVEEQKWKFDGTKGTAWRVRLPLNADVLLKVSDEVQPFGKLLPRGRGPWVTINGGFYEAIPGEDDAFRPMGLVVADATEVSSLTKRGGSGVFYVDDEGPAIVHRRDFAAAPRVALQSIDRIVADGESVVSRRDDAKRAARSGVIVGKEYLWFVIAVADQDINKTSKGARLSKSGSGFPLWAFADYIVATTDADDALNLDGGVSTQMVVQDGDFGLYVYGVRGTINALVARPHPPGDD